MNDTVFCQLTLTKLDGDGGAVVSAGASQQRGRGFHAGPGALLSGMFSPGTPPGCWSLCVDLR